MRIHTASIHIRATTQSVFEALSKPELIRLWQYGKEMSGTWETGSTIIFSVEYDRHKTEQRGTVLAFRPCELISYTLFTPKPGVENKPENYQTTSYLLSEENDGTRLELTQEEPVFNALTDINLHPILDMLKRTVEALA